MRITFWGATVIFCVECLVLIGCSSQPSEQGVSHPSAITKQIWLSSDYEIVSREVKEFNDHSGTYIVLTIRHGNKRITAELATANKLDVILAGRNADALIPMSDTALTTPDRK